MNEHEIYLTQHTDYFNNQQSIENILHMTFQKSDTILFSQYIDGDNGSGEVWIIFKNNNLLYEIFATQSSVHDMNDYLEKEETSWEEIFYRIHHGGHQQYNINFIKEKFNFHVKNQDMNIVTEYTKKKIEAMDSHELFNFLITSANNQDLNIVKHILTSPTSVSKIDIHKNNDWLLQCVCNTGNVDMVKFLLLSPELKEHSNIYVNNGSLFHVAARYHPTLLNFLIFDYKIDANRIEKLTKSLKKLFNTRDLSEKLTQDLSLQKTHSNKIKI